MTNNVQHNNDIGRRTARNYRKGDASTVPRANIEKRPADTVNGIRIVCGLRKSNTETLTVCCYERRLRTITNGTKVIPTSCKGGGRAIADVTRDGSNVNGRTIFDLEHPTRSNSVADGLMTLGRSGATIRGRISRVGSA